MDTGTRTKATSLSWRSYFKAQLTLKVITSVLLVIAILVMINSAQTAYVFQIEFKARYKESAALRLLFYIDIGVCISSLLTLVVICARYPEPSDSFISFMFWHDLIAMTLLVAGCAAGASVGYIAKYGQEQTGWTAICSMVEKFCNKVMTSIGLSSLAFLCLFVLTVLSFRH